MQKALFLKTLIVLALTLLIAVPLSLIDSTISERMQYREEAVHSIATDSVGEQTVIGPLLVIPYTDEWEEEVAIPPKTKKIKRNGEWEEEEVANSPKTKKVKHNDNKRLIVFPNELHIKGSI